tara:strand:+ start:409 stop:618 length:210 start_codon:yes stop_codon:yes gene_type:complete
MHGRKNLSMFWTLIGLLAVILLTTLLILFFTSDEEEYIALTPKGREALAALLMKEVEKNPDLLNDSDDD